MEIRLLAFESLGVRSQATFIQTRDTTIIIDPSAALAPRRYGLAPHRREVERLLYLFGVISEFLRESEVVVITHYHYDHHDPARFIDPESYRGKRLLVKDPKNYINVSQRIRAHRFLSIVKDKVRSIEVVDSTTMVIGKTRINVSMPVPHGEDSKLGYVIELCIDDGDTRVLYTSDVEGAPLHQQIDFALRCRPHIAIVDGIPTYLIGHGYSYGGLKNALKSLMKLLEVMELECVVYDHHAARELNYMEAIAPVIDHARMLGKRIVSAAEFMGLEPLFLEAMRKKLYMEEPVSGIEMLKSKRLGLSYE